VRAFARFFDRFMWGETVRAAGWNSSNDEMLV